MRGYESTSIIPYPYNALRHDCHTRKMKMVDILDAVAIIGWWTREGGNATENLVPSAVAKASRVAGALVPASA